jgi:O-antigen chain-terminating methyltransferase
VVRDDAVAYLESLPDESVGGIMAAQVVEHLEPDTLIHLLDAAHAKLTPGGRIVLETINPSCWFAFFESYVRDLTHVQPVHADTLKYLLQSTGFQRVEIRYRSPFPESDKLQPVPVPIDGGQLSPDLPLLRDMADTVNQNVEKLNRLLFTYLDYAAIGERL